MLPKLKANDYLNAIAQAQLHMFKTTESIECFSMPKFEVNLKHHQATAVYPNLSYQGEESFSLIIGKARMLIRIIPSSDGVPLVTVKVTGRRIVQKFWFLDGSRKKI
jgi:hypothetical protein